MLTEKQKTWLNHLSDTDEVKILPFDPKAKEYFEQQKNEIQAILGEGIEVVHMGASNMGISGQNDIYIYIPVPLEHLDELLEKLRQVYGNPGSHYPDERARFNRYKDETKMEVHLINRAFEGWITSNTFETYLKIHPEALEEYKKLKESLAGKSTRKYYTRKTEFINEILERASLEDK